jgi:hypothetical protein
MPADVRQAADNAAPAIRDYTAAARTAMDLVRGHHAPNLAAFGKLFTTVEQDLPVLENALNAHASAASVSVHEEKGRALTLLLIIVVVCAAALAMMCGWVGRGILRPLREVGLALDGMATGDLSRTVAVSSDNEIGRLSRSLNTGIANVDDLQTMIAAAVEEQTATTNEMNRGVAQAAERSSEIAGGTGRVAWVGPAVHEAGRHRTRRRDDVVVPARPGQGRPAAVHGGHRIRRVHLPAAAARLAGAARGGRPSHVDGLPPPPVGGRDPVDDPTAGGAAQW